MEKRPLNGCLSVFTGCDNHVLQIFYDYLQSVISKITNSALSDIQWLKASVPITHGGPWVKRCHQSQFLPFWHQWRVPFPSKKTSYRYVPPPLTHALNNTCLHGPHRLVYHQTLCQENSPGTDLVFWLTVHLSNPYLFTRHTERGSWLCRCRMAHSGDWLLALPITNRRRGSASSCQYVAQAQFVCPTQLPLWNPS